MSLPQLLADVHIWVDYTNCIIIQVAIICHLGLFKLARDYRWHSHIQIRSMCNAWQCYMLPCQLLLLLSKVFHKWNTIGVGVVDETTRGMFPLLQCWAISVSVTQRDVFTYIEFHAWHDRARSLTKSLLTFKAPSPHLFVTVKLFSFDEIRNNFYDNITSS